MLPFSCLPLLADSQPVHMGSQVLLILASPNIIWVNHLKHSFLVGCLKPCLQGTGVKFFCLNRPNMEAESCLVLSLKKHCNMVDYDESQSFDYFKRKSSRD